MSLGLERLERPDDVLRTEEAPVVEARPGAKRVRRPRPVLGDLDGLREQPVLGKRLVGRLDHQRVEEFADAGGGDTLQDEGVQVVEGPEGRELDGAALGGAGAVYSKCVKPGPYLRSP